MTKKGKKKGQKQQPSEQVPQASGSQQQGAPAAQQQQQARGSQQQQRPPAAQQQRPPGPQQQHQQRPPGPQQQQQQRPPVPQQQQQQPAGPWQQQRLPIPQQQQQQRPPGPQQQQQQRPPVPQQQQQQRQPGPQQQQQRPPVPQQQQQQPAGPWQQQRPPIPQQQQQQRPPGPQQQQQQRPPGPQQQQQRPPVPQQQQQQPAGPWQQQRLPIPQQQQQQRPPGPQQQQQQKPPGPQQQQQRPPVPQQQQQPAGPWQQQRLPIPQQQQQQRPPGPQQQQQQRPPTSEQQPSFPAQQQKPSPSTSQQPQETAVSLKRRNGKVVLPTALKEAYIEQIPRKKNAGTQGRKIQVETNMLKIVLKPNFKTNIIHYDVVITPDKPKFMFRTIFELYRRKHFPNRYPAFDGRKNAYSGNDLPFDSTSVEDEIKVLDPERQQERVWKIYLRKVAILDLSWLRGTEMGYNEGEKEEKGLQALDVIFRHGPAYTFTPVGKSLFPRPEPGRVISLSDGMDLWIGVFQSVAIGKKAYLNIDVAHKGFPKDQSIIDLMRELCRPPRQAQPLATVQPRDVERNKEKITKFLKGLKIQYELPGQPTTRRTYRVNELVRCPRENKFRLENNTMCTVEQYYLEKKNYRIQFPDLPCLWVGSRNNNIHLPVELCTIVGGQVTQKKLNEDQTTNLIRHAATDTRTRKAKIMAGFASMNLNQQPTLMNEFHLSVQGEFEKVPARILQAPVLQYNKNQVNVVKGVWRADKFIKPCELPDLTWTILNLDGRTQDRDLYRLQDSLQNGAVSVNMSIGKALTPFGNLMLGRNISNIMEYFQDKKKQNLRLVVVVIPVFDNASYSVVKQISELKVTGGVVTQCLKSKTLMKLSPSTVTNILLKINSKLNGVNHKLAPTYLPPCLSVPCMLIGADVTHPSPDAVDIPSIAAVAASHDPSAFQYNVQIRIQSPREEMIQSLEEIMRKQLIYFFQKTSYKPRKIIFYRDGVSEGQLPQVMHFELSAIKRAIAKLEGSTEHKIPITFLVVQKRHHIRLFPTDNNCDQKNFNVLAGTIVDTEITHPTQVDFYLVSHASIQGTARPTKYRCICNENDLSEDEIEQLTYYLCHMFARCTRSVSYPAPTYYAHLAAARARALIHGVPLDINNLEEAQRVNMTLQMNENSPMFFV
ncbi:argonaute 2 isoform X2 [Osmia lignaria lignaria]|uniref:argonaute 2 isoform X2 n=1 Tax=Osmia lignaria lignaria TaxID=1437193 RepID=UPI00402BB3E2